MEEYTLGKLGKVEITFYWHLLRSFSGWMERPVYGPLYENTQGKRTGKGKVFYVLGLYVGEWDVFKRYS